MQKRIHNLTITRETQGKLPSLPFLRIKNEVLGPDYELSLAFVGRKRAVLLHQEFKSKNDPVNILSFPFSKSEGEIIISLEKARRECKILNERMKIISRFFSFTDARTWQATFTEIKWRQRKKGCEKSLGCNPSFFII